MYIRYTQPPSDLFDWYEAYLQDEEEIDVKAGGGQVSWIYLIFLFSFLNNYFFRLCTLAQCSDNGWLNWIGSQHYFQEFQFQCKNKLKNV